MMRALDQHNFVAGLGAIAATITQLQLGAITGDAFARPAFRTAIDLLPAPTAWQVSARESTVPQSLASGALDLGNAAVGLCDFNRARAAADILDAGLTHGRAPSSTLDLRYPVDKAIGCAKNSRDPRSGQNLRGPITQCGPMPSRRSRVGIELSGGFVTG